MPLNSAEKIAVARVEPHGVRVLVLDRAGWVYHGSTAVLRARAELEVVGRAVDVADVVRQWPVTQPSLVFVNLPPDPQAALHVIQDLRRRLADVQLVAFSTQTSAAFIRSAFEAGVAALLSTDDDAETLAEVVRAVAQGRRFVPPRLTEILLTATWGPAPDIAVDQVLSRRETDVLRLIADGKTSRQIAGELGIALTTVQAHRSNIMKKLDIHKAVGLAQYWNQHHPRAH